MSDREEFERHFPKPDGVFWDGELSQYEASEMECEPDADEHHRMWQVWQAARAQSVQGAEPVAYMFADECGRTKIVLGKETAEHWCPPDETVTPLYTQPQPAQQGSVPEGWKLVPVEPTATMISAFEHAPCAENYTDAATWAWEAMLDAAPQPPQEGA